MLQYDYDNNKYLLHWPENSRLKKAIEENMNNISYTMPGIKDDYSKEYVDYQYKETFNLYFSHLDLDMNQKGLSWFIKRGLFDVALYATSEMLTWMNNGKDMCGKPSEITQELMEIWSIRFQLLMHLSHHSKLLSEISVFEELDAPDLYYQFKNTEKRGSLVPFSMRLIHSECLRFSPFPWKAVVRLKKLLRDVESVISDLTPICADEVLKCWESRLESVKILYIRVLHSLGEYILSSVSLRDVNNSNYNVGYIFSLMRMSMQAGDEKAMNSFIEEHNKYSSDSTNAILHKAFRSIFLGGFSHALDYLDRIKDNNLSQNQIINTKAVGLLYTAQARRAVEDIVQNKSSLKGTTNKNLKTIYDLCYPSNVQDDVFIK